MKKFVLVCISFLMVTLLSSCLTTIHADKLDYTSTLGKRSVAFSAADSTSQTSIKSE